MTLKEKIIEALADDYTSADDLAIEQLLSYYDIFKQAAKDLKAEGYRRRVAATPIPGIRPEENARYFMNIAFPVMNDCSRQIRAQIEALGLSKKGKRIEVINKIEKTLLERMNDIPDDED